MMYVKTRYKTIHGKPIHMLMQHEDDSNFRFVTLKTKHQLKKEQKFYGKSVNLISHNYIDPAESPKLFEESPFHFSGFVQSMLHISKWLLPHYADYIKRGISKERAFEKAAINYEECNNGKLDGIYYTSAYDIVKAAYEGISA